MRNKRDNRAVRDQSPSLIVHGMQPCNEIQAKVPYLSSSCCRYQYLFLGPPLWSATATSPEPYLPVTLAAAARGEVVWLGTRRYRAQLCFAGATRAVDDDESF